MSEVFYFLRRGWNMIWRMRTAWLFSALSAVSGFSPAVLSFQETSLSGLWNSLAGNLIFLILVAVATLGLPHDIYRFVTGRPATIAETFSAVQKFAGRAIGCASVVVLIPLLCFSMVVLLFRNTAFQPFQPTMQILTVLLLFAVFGAPMQFPLFEFFAKDAGLWQALRDGWRLFTAHVFPLVSLGLLLMVITKAVSALAAVATVLIQSGFEAAALGALNYLDPASSLEGNLLFITLSSGAQMINSTWQVTVFVMAYLKYSGVEEHVIAKA